MPTNPGANARLPNSRDQSPKALTKKEENFDSITALKRKNIVLGRADQGKAAASPPISDHKISETLDLFYLRCQFPTAITDREPLP